MNSNGPASPRPISWVSVIWMVAAAVGHVPLGLYLGQRGAVTQPAAHALIFATVSAGGVAGIWLAVRFGRNRSVATCVVVSFFVIFWSGGTFIALFGVVGGVIVGSVVLVLIALIVSRLRSVPGLHMVFFGLSVYLALVPLTAYEPSLEVDSVVPDAAEAAYEAGGHRPDVFVIVLDGYPGIQSLSSMPDWTGDIVRELANRGFFVRPAWSAYANTTLSLSGLLDGSYPYEPGSEWVSDTTIAEALITDGAAASFQFFDRAGYQSTVVESPWNGYDCPPQVEHCVSRPVIDELLFYTLERSYLQPLLNRLLGSAWIHGANHAWNWLAANSDSLTANGIPTSCLPM
jgi:hypothetical protein